MRTQVLPCIAPLTMFLMMIVSMSEVYAQDKNNSKETETGITQAQKNSKDKNTESPDTKSTKQLPVIPKSFREDPKNEIWELGLLELPWITQDDDNDGTYDSAMIISKNYTLEQQALDRNDDGLIDSIAYFDAEGLLIFEKIDSNFDKKYDLWLEIDAGEKINRIQKDSDFDGYVDYYRDFTTR